MKYFCVRCQRRHEVKGIVPDLLSVMKEPMLNSLEKRILEGGLSKSAVIQLSAAAKAVSTLEPGAFSLDREDLKKTLSNPREEGQNLTGRLTFTLAELAGRMKLDIGSLPAMTVFDREMTFQYSSTEDGSLVFRSCHSGGDYFGTAGFHRLCGSCGARLQQCVGLAEETVIVLAGAPRAGKTSCVTALAHRLSGTGDENHGISLIHYNRDLLWLKKELAVYEKGQKVEKTPTAQEYAGASSFHLKLGRKSAIITLVDMPGEFFTSGDGLSADFFRQYQGIFRNTDVIWLFLSKPSVLRANLKADKNLARLTADDTDTVEFSSPERIQANFHCMIDHVYNGGKVPPVCVILTKTDAAVGDAQLDRCYGLFPGERVFQTDREDTAALFAGEALNLRSIFSQGSRVRAFFSAHAPRYWEAIEDCFPERYYTAISAYGGPARDREDPAGAPVPYHALHPLIWTLAVTGKLPVKHEFQVVRRNLLGGVRRTSREMRVCTLANREVCRNLFSQTPRYLPTATNKHGKGM